MQRIGIYGGTFNPPHLGHVQAALAAVDKLELDRLLVIPDRIPPHKSLPAGAASPEQRLEMLRLALSGAGAVEVSELELRREGVSYTVDTLRELRKQYPQATLILLMGTDMFLSFHSWRCPEEILSMAELGVFYRGEPGEKAAVEAEAERLRRSGAKITAVDNAVVEMSSTELRRLLAFDCARPLLPPGVEAYIRENGLYGTGRSLKNLPMEELEQVVVSLLKPSRVAHVLGCRDTAAKLAQRWGADVTDAARAGLLHDITKALDGPAQLTLCAEYGTILDGFSKKYPKTLHALTGALVAERIFGENPAVVSAIASHTTGKADMNVLEKIIYVADYMEPNRVLPGVERLRELAFTDLDGALKLGLQMTLAHLKEQGAEASPESLRALAFLN